MKYLLLIFICLFLAGCATNIYNKYPHPDNSNGIGKVIVKLSEPLAKVNVTIGGTLVAEDKHTKRIEVSEVPVGEHEVIVIAASASRKSSVRVEKTVTVEADRDAVVLVEAPPLSTGYWIYTSIIMAVLLMPMMLTNSSY